MRVSEDPTRGEAQRGSPDEEARWQDARAALSAPLTPMGVRGGEPLDVSTPDADIVGDTAITTLLADLDFPQTREQLLDRCGTWRFPVEPGHMIPLGDVLKNLPDRTYETPEAVARAARSILPRHRKFNDHAANLPKTEFFRPHGLP